MDLIIKPMETEKEIKGKAYVHWRSWQEAYAGLVPADYLAGLTLAKCEALAYRWRENLLVAADHGRVIGFAGYGGCRDTALENTGEVFALYILAAYYGQGVGHRLMQAALDALAAYPRVAVWVLKDNRRAIRFYERCGFRADGTEKTIDLGTPLAEVRMVLVR